MKYIKVPASVVPMNLHTREPITDDKGVLAEPLTFWTVLSVIWLNDPRFSGTHQALQAERKISDAFWKQEPGTWVGIEDAHYQILKTVVEEPKRSAGPQQVSGWTGNEALARQSLTFIEAVLGAVDKIPEESKAA